MRARRTLLFFASLLLTSSAVALPATQIVLKASPHHATAALAADTADYIRNAAIIDMFEVNAAKLAIDKARDFSVQRFARMMLSDYDASGASLAATLSQATFQMTLPDGLDDPHTNLVEQLRSSPDEGFDAAYMQQQVIAQQSALRLHASYARIGRDRALRTYAAQILPQIRMRLALAERVFREISPKSAAR
jgi:putative membrane protein